MKKMTLFIALGLLHGSNLSFAGGIQSFGLPTNLSAYAGGSLGLTSHEGACKMAGSKGSNCAKDDNGHKFFAGIRAAPKPNGTLATPAGNIPSALLPTLGVELGHMELGKSKSDGKAGRRDIYDAELSSTVTASYLAATGYMPLTPQVELIGKGGAAFWEQKGKKEVPQDPEINTETSNTGVGLLFGAGAQYRMTSNFAIRGEYERLLGTAADTSAESDADLLSVGAVFSTY